MSHKMLSIFAVLITVVSAVPSLLARPPLEVPACPSVGTVTYNTSVPGQGPFPRTQVDLCYDDSSIQIKFTAFEEKDFYCMCNQFPLLLARPTALDSQAPVDTADPQVTDNQSLTTNGEIYNYEVMEAFVVRAFAYGILDSSCSTRRRATNHSPALFPGGLKHD